MKGLRRLCWIGTTALVLGACKLGSAMVCRDSDRACQERGLNTHPIKFLAAWRAELEKPIAQRVGNASAGLIEFITLDNQFNGFAERPSIPTLDAGFLADFTAALHGLPPEVLHAVGNRLVGIRFVANLGGSGYTDYVYDSAGQVAGAFVVFDAAVLQSMTANQWATWKERTPFKPEPGYALDATIEEAALDNRQHALQYILLHELGHVASVGRNLHPNWNLPVQKQAAATERFPFFETTWMFDAAGPTIQSRFDRDFVQRKDVKYYGVARLPATAMVPTYTRLEQTSFATLYAATSPGDDFAEAFANYVHVVLLKRPWHIVLTRNGQVTKTITPCWDERRCTEKRRLIEELLSP